MGLKSDIHVLDIQPLFPSFVASRVAQMWLCSWCPEGGLFILA